MRNLILLFLSTTLLFAAQAFYYNNNQKVQLTPLSKDHLESRSAQQSREVKYYVTPNRSVVGISDEILVDTEDIEYILNSYGVELIVKLGESIYLLRAKDASQTLDIANELYEDKRVKLAHPNFIKEVQKR